MSNFIHSATVMVRDQDAALDFYVNVLGWEKRQDSPFSEGSRWVVVAPPDRETGLALLRPEDMDAPADRVGGFTGISIVSDDIQGTYEMLLGKGVQFTAPLDAMPWGAKATWFMDQDGNQFFLTEG